MRRWSAETPELYTLLLDVADDDGNHLETISTRIGFRSVEIRDAQLLVNGVAVLLKGTNRHEHDPDTARIERIRTGLPGAAIATIQVGFLPRAPSSMAVSCMLPSPLQSSAYCGSISRNSRISPFFHISSTMRSVFSLNGLEFLNR